jgi:D-alanyl-D-alanine carboxypeptidase
MFVSVAGGSNFTPSSVQRTPKTLPLETIQSRGSISHQSFKQDEIHVLEETLDKIIMKTEAKGISAAVGMPDRGMWFAARGTTGNKSKREITPDLKFYAGSIGKIFTAVVILKLIEEGRLSLESPVEEWFPEISQASHITINHLLTHTSGIPSFENVKEYQARKDRYHNPEEILLYINKKKLLFEPGKHYAYSNTGYVMLGIAIERITGRSYKEAIEEHIIRRVKLHETEVITEQTLKKLIVKGHHHGNVITKAEHYANPFAAGAIIATPKDLILFFQALMNGRLLSQDSLQKMFSDMNLTTVTQSVYYGKGIVAAIETPIGDIIGHTGGIRGFGAALYYHPKENIFVCVMMNDDIKPIDPAMFRFMEAMMET